MFAFAPTCDAPYTTCVHAALLGESLSERERALALLTTVLVLADHDLIAQAVVCAQQVGLTTAEIGQTSTLVRAVQDVVQRYGRHGSPAGQPARR